MSTDVYRPAHFRLKLSGGFLLLLALIWFFDSGGFLPPLAAAVCAHECGHIAALFAFGARPARLRASLSGFELDYRGYLNAAQTALAALAGPAAGAAFAAVCLFAGRKTGGSFPFTCAGISVVLTLFNLLPVSPLDGGICAEFVLCHLFSADFARYTLSALAAAVLFLLLAGGLYCLLSGDGPALFLAGVWLFALRRNRTCNRL